MKSIKTFVLAAIPAFLLGATAFADEGGGGLTTAGAGAIGAALAIGLAAFGGALGQGKTASAALEGMARNPQANLLVPMILGLALIESLVVFALLIAFGLSPRQ